MNTTTRQRQKQGQSSPSDGRKGKSATKVESQPRLRRDRGGEASLTAGRRVVRDMMMEGVGIKRVRGVGLGAEFNCQKVQGTTRSCSVKILALAQAQAQKDKGTTRESGRVQVRRASILLYRHETTRLLQFGFRFDYSDTEMLWCNPRYR